MVFDSRRAILVLPPPAILGLVQCQPENGDGSLIAEHLEVPIAASVALPNAPIRTVDLMPTI